MRSRGAIDDCKGTQMSKERLQYNLICDCIDVGIAYVGRGPRRRGNPALNTGFDEGAEHSLEEAQLTKKLTEVHVF